MRILSDMSNFIIWSGKRKGTCLDFTKRAQKRIRPNSAAPSKYSTVPHPLMRLSRMALPPEANSQDNELAVGNFSKSVTRDTQSGYATAARHYLAAERALGRSFSLPPTEKEMVYLVNFLTKKELDPKTIRSYLSGIRFYLLSMGIATPPNLPP